MASWGAAAVIRVAWLLGMGGCGRLGFDATDAADSLLIDAPFADLCGDTSGQDGAAPWPTIHGCPTNAGRSRYSGPATGTIALPPFGTLTGRRGLAIASGGRVVVADTDSIAAALVDRVTGVETWRTTDTFGFNLEPFPVLDARGISISTTSYGRIYGYDLVDGRTVIDMQFAGILTPPALGPVGRLYVGSNAPYGFVAVDTVAKTTLWQYPVPGDVSASPALGHDRVYVVDATNSRLYAFDAATGAIRFNVDVPGMAHDAPVLGTELVYVATLQGVSAFDALSGAMVWQHVASTAMRQPALLANGDLVVGTVDGEISILDPVRGESSSVLSLGTALGSRITVDATDAIYLATSSELRSYEPRTKTLRWISPVVGAFALGDGYIAVTPPGGTLAVIAP